MGSDLTFIIRNAYHVKMMWIISSRKENNIHKENIYHFVRPRSPIHVSVPVMPVTTDWKKNYQYLVINDTLANTYEYSPYT